MVDVKGRKKKQTQEAALYQVRTEECPIYTQNFEGLLICCQPVYSQYTNSLQDPTTIEHETTPSGAIYAVVDKPKRGSSKKSEPVCSQNQHTHSLQDPNTIEHETAPSGDIYTEVDKPKRGSLKKSEPDVVPPGSQGVSH